MSSLIEDAERLARPKGNAMDTIYAALPADVRDSLVDLLHEPSADGKGHRFGAAVVEEVLRKRLGDERWNVIGIGESTIRDYRRKGWRPTV